MCVPMRKSKNPRRKSRREEQCLGKPQGAGKSTQIWQSTDERGPKPNSCLTAINSQWASVYASVK